MDMSDASLSANCERRVFSICNFTHFLKFFISIVLLIVGVTNDSF